MYGKAKQAPLPMVGGVPAPQAYYSAVNLGIFKYFQMSTLLYPIKQITQELINPQPSL